MGRRRTRRSRPPKNRRAAPKTRRNVQASIAPFREATCPHGRRVGYQVDVERSVAALVLGRLDATRKLDDDVRELLAASVMAVLRFPLDLYTPDEFVEMARAAHAAGLLPIVGDRAMLPTPGMFGLTHDEARNLALEAEDRIRTATRKEQQ